MVIHGSITTTSSGRRKAKVQRSKLLHKGHDGNWQHGPVRRVTKEYPSAASGGCNTAAPERKIASNATIAPAYNKGAYQVISKENVKDIGR